MAEASGSSNKGPSRPRRRTTKQASRPTLDFTPAGDLSDFPPVETEFTPDEDDGRPAPSIDRPPPPPPRPRGSDRTKDGPPEKREIDARLPDDTGPLDLIAGKSASLRALEGWRWPTGQSYLAPAIFALLDELAGSRGVPVIGLVDFVRWLVSGRSRQATLFAEMVRPLDIAPVLDFEPPLTAATTSPEAGKAIDPEPVLRWDLVEFLIAAGQSNPQTFYTHQLPLDEIAIIATLFTTVEGQAAMRDAGLFEQGSDALQRLVLTQFYDRLKQEGSDESQRRRFGQAAGAIESAPLLISETAMRPRAAFSADRAIAITDDTLGVLRDAQALCDLILLESVRPPLAIGLFGPWGSGKSTLIKTLQERVRAELAQPRSEPQVGDDTDTRRVGTAVQIELNAWTFADSPNLWASLTSEIFDQLASGGIDASDDAFARIVEEVKHRSSRELATSITTRANVADAQSRLEAAQQQVLEARNRRSVALPSALADVAKAALDTSDPKGGPQKVQILFAEPVATPEKSALSAVRGALGGPGGGEARAKAYAEAGSDMARFVLVLRDYLKALPPSKWLTAAGLAAAVGILVWLVGATRLVTYVGTIAGALAVLSRPILTAWRFAGLLSRRLDETKTAADAAVESAKAAVAEQEAKLTTAQSQLAQSEVFLARYGGAGEANAASPGLMLDYLLSCSEDVEAVRSQLGILAKVRRCFEQLDAILSREDSKVNRIILYIDDLDRCDAAQVAQVLQAVHLLLAFRCFVVIAAVDARWLKQSLEIQNRQFRSSQPGAATAADYLEKIFQIPFWVGGMVDEDAIGSKRYDAYRSFIDQLVPPPASTGKAGIGANAGSATPSASPLVGPTDRVMLTGVEPFKPAGPVTDVPRQTRLRLTQDERLWLRELGPLAAKSPRAVKRMVNVYRLIRVREYGRVDPGAPGEDSTSFRAIAFALALQIGNPEAFELLSGKLTQMASENMKDGAPQLPRGAALAIHLSIQSNPDWAPINALLTDLCDKEMLRPEFLLAAMEEVRRFAFQPRKAAETST